MVRFPKPKQESFLGKVIFVSRAADAASSTLRTRIEVANKSNRPAGEHVSITFPTPEKEVALKDTNKQSKSQHSTKK